MSYVSVQQIQDLLPKHPEPGGRTISWEHLSDANFSDWSPADSSQFLLTKNGTAAQRHAVPGAAHGLYMLGIVGADVRPNWLDKPPPESLTRDSLHGADNALLAALEPTPGRPFVVPYGTEPQRGLAHTHHQRGAMGATDQMMEKVMNMLRTEIRELTDSDLDHVAGAGTAVQTTVVAIPGTIESGAEKDPNIGTHTQLWVTTTTIKT